MFNMYDYNNPYMQQMQQFPQMQQMTQIPQMQQQRQQNTASATINNIAVTVEKL